MKSALDSLAAAIHGFLSTAPRVPATSRNVDIPRRGTPPATRPLTESDLGIDQFIQIWSNTAVMFDRSNMLSGQAFTSAHTTVITHGGRSVIYCDGARAYSVDSSCDAFVEDLATRTIANVETAQERYSGWASA